MPPVRDSETGLVSIHASVMEATAAQLPGQPRELVSIHASVMEATRAQRRTCCTLEFRSTPP